MKTQLLSLVLFIAPLMLQIMLSENNATTTEPAPASPKVAVKEQAAVVQPSAAVKPASTKPTTPAKSSSHIPAKLAPWFM